MPRKVIFLVISYVCILCNASISHVILNDLRNAFRIVANNTQELNQILQQMFELQKVTPHIVFNIPTTNGHLYNRVKMQHSDFGKPNYPNLPSTYMTNMKNKWQKIYAKSENVSLWGLDDWQDEMIRPIIKQSEENHNSNEYPSLEILSALEQNEHKFSLEATQMQWSNDDIYIARANHPFGYSSKWMPRNLTNARNQKDDRSKRGIPALYSMIKCATKCDPTIFQGHGCFCGFLGNGIPEDSVDRCCQNHDKCYGQSKCIKFIEYFVPYLWKCYNGKPICANNHGIWGDGNSCAAKLCECDLKLSYCLRKQICLRQRSTCSSSRARRIQNFLFVK